MTTHQKRMTAEVKQRISRSLRRRHKEAVAAKLDSKPVLLFRKKGQRRPIVRDNEWKGLCFRLLDMLQEQLAK